MIGAANAVDALRHRQITRARSVLCIDLLEVTVIDGAGAP
jgi:hypothetical protein